jgi:hypothetical protein
MLEDLGLDPDDDQENEDNPVGIGNMAAKTLIRLRDRDGMNALGDENGIEFNQRPYSDYTGYTPVNTPNTLVNPSRWQPQILPHTYGNYRYHH